MNHVVKVNGLGKAYRLGLVGGVTLREDIKRVWARMRGKPDPLLAMLDNKDAANQGGYIWALKDINFEIEEGEVFGVIGKNGAGKSTLLKLLSRITQPSKGSIEIHGRTASMLEVGTGFHPELTGRENVYLNAAILGMKKKEVDVKLDEIIDFSEVENFIDTPVKRYSTGMKVRLAFAVGAHLDPEILIIDEVLAVGDAEFQKKCIDKMKAVASEGRTVLFVSHNMISVKTLCTRCLLLKNGQIDLIGDVDESIDKYLSRQMKIEQEGIVPDDAGVINTGEVKIKKINLLDDDGKLLHEAYYHSPLHFRVAVQVFQPVSDARMSIRFSTTDGIVVSDSGTFYNNEQSIELKVGDHEVDIEVANHLQPGHYYMSIGVGHISGQSIHYLENIMEFRVSRIAKEKKKDYKNDQIWGYIHSESKWSLKKV